MDTSAFLRKFYIGLAIVWLAVAILVALQNYLVNHSLNAVLNITIIAIYPFYSIGLIYLATKYLFDVVNIGSSEKISAKSYIAFEGRLFSFTFLLFFLTVLYFFTMKYLKTLIFEWLS